jgi:hypothetical protein
MASPTRQNIINFIVHTITQHFHAYTRIILTSLANRSGTTCFFFSTKLPLSSAFTDDKRELHSERMEGDDDAEDFRDVVVPSRRTLGLEVLLGFGPEEEKMPILKVVGLVVIVGVVEG